MEKELVLPEELWDNIRSRLPLREIFQTSLVCKRWAQVCKSSRFCDQVCSKIPNLNSKSLAKVIEYCKYHGEADRLSGDKAEDEIKTWDQDFVKVDRATLIDLMNAAHHLNIKSLLDLACQYVADMIIDKGMSVEEIRQFLNIENDFTPEEEERVRQEFQWAFAY